MTYLHYRFDLLLKEKGKGKKKKERNKEKWINPYFKFLFDMVVPDA